jgi:hypothetical protein
VPAPLEYQTKTVQEILNQISSSLEQDAVEYTRQIVRRATSIISSIGSKTKRRRDEEQDDDGGLYSLALSINNYAKSHRREDDMANEHW